MEIKGGTLSITSESDEAIYVNDITNEGTGLPNYGNVTISGGNVTLTANSDGIDVNAFMDEEGNIIGGNITISGGNITITAESSGLESSADTTITGGMITITADTDKDGDPALYVMGTLTVDVPIILPENGCILVTNDFETIADSEGNIAYSVKLGNAQNSGEGSASVYEPESTFDYEHWQKSLYMMFTRRYLITASAAEGGTITNEGTVNTRYGTSVTYHITPDEGYEIVSVIVNGEDIGAVEEYTFKGISADHTISAVFAKVQ